MNSKIYTKNIKWKYLLFFIFLFIPLFFNDININFKKYYNKLVHLYEQLLIISFFYVLLDNKNNFYIYNCMQDLYYNSFFF